MARPSVRLVLLASLSLFTACAAHVDETMRSWEGHQFSDLVASWGPPQQVFDDGSGGKILVYAGKRRWTSPGQATTTTTGSVYGYGGIANLSAYSTTTYRPPEQYGYTAYRMFWVDRSGVIYRWAWKGL